MLWLFGLGLLGLALVLVGYWLLDIDNGRTPLSKHMCTLVLTLSATAIFCFTLAVRGPLAATTPAAVASAMPAGVSANTPAVPVSQIYGTWASGDDCPRTNTTYAAHTARLFIVRAIPEMPEIPPLVQSMPATYTVRGESIVVDLGKGDLEAWHFLDRDTMESMAMIRPDGVQYSPLELARHPHMTPPSVDSLTLRPDRTEWRHVFHRCAASVVQHVEAQIAQLPGAKAAAAQAADERRSAAKQALATDKYARVLYEVNYTYDVASRCEYYGPVTSATMMNMLGIVHAMNGVVMPKYDMEMTRGILDLESDDAKAADCAAERTRIERSWAAMQGNAPQ